GIRLNRIISEFDRRADHLTAAQHERLATAHEYVRLMMNCPRRMRLDDVWPNDFVVAARAATDALLSVVQVEESGH
ncbi:MAG TPA: hypothetical protein VFB34_07745, partial [Chloroflexota bacterium]|nr:hypothetical protein [Chloroflexota bacterium]